MVGAPLDDGTVSDAGRAYLFDGDPMSPGYGDLLATLENPTPTFFDEFGWAMAPVGDTMALVSAHKENGPTDNGIVYLFDVDPVSPNLGDVLMTINNPTPTVRGYVRRGDCHL